MPDRWETRHGLSTQRDNAAGDPDGDGLANLAEYHRGGDPSDEDSDNDGHDDGDEVRDGDRSTDLDDRDSDDDDTLDGDEDSDDDGVDNEDEDDGDERCTRDDDDRDRDHVSDEDENDFGYRAGDDDSDDDGVLDGNEDSDDDGQSDEDDDDSDDDSCSGHHGEDGDDLLGPIVSFDESTGALVIDAVRAGQLTFVVTPTPRSSSTPPAAARARRATPATWSPGRSSSRSTSRTTAPWRRSSWPGPSSTTRTDYPVRTTRARRLPSRWRALVRRGSSGWLRGSW